MSWHSGDRTGVGTFTSSCLWVLGAAARAAHDQLLTRPAKLPGGAGVGAAGRGKWDGWIVEVVEFSIVGQQVLFSELKNHVFSDVPLQ